MIMPPYKPISNACLACRHAKTRCDGIKPVCGKCQRLDKSCMYVESMRGGARVSKIQLNTLLGILPGLLVAQANSPHLPAIENPSACVSYLDNRSVNQVFHDYYEHLYPSFPILPPRNNAASYLERVPSDSPLLPAILALTVLAPSIALPFDDRQGASMYFAARASEDIELALSKADPSLDIIQALYLLSIWNWGQSGKASKSRTLAVQALQLCMELRLHQMDRHGSLSSSTPGYSESCRRTWWASFCLHTTLSVVSSISPMIELRDQRLYTAYPVCRSVPDAWKNYVETADRCQVVAVETAQLATAESQPMADVEAYLRRLHSLDADTQRILATLSSTLSPDIEDDVALNMAFTERLGLSTSIIHLHRHQAFSDAVVYSRDSCGLQNRSSIGVLHQVSDSGGSRENGSPKVAAGKFELSDVQTATEEIVPNDKVSSILCPAVVDNKGSDIDDQRSLVLRSFPPQISMQRCVAAADRVEQSYRQLRAQTHSRLAQMLQELSQMPVADNSPMISPICACGMVTAVYAYILFSLYTCAQPPGDADKILWETISRIESLHRVLQDAGTIWSTVRVMADEVQAALTALRDLIKASRADTHLFP